MQHCKSILRFMTAALIVCCGLASCSKDKPEVTPSLVIDSSPNMTFSSGASSAVLSMRCNVAWEIVIPSSAAWIKADPMNGDGNGISKSFKVTLSVEPLTGVSRNADLVINYGGKSKTVKVSQSSLPQCSQFDIPDDMVFSTTLGRNSTNVAQGFDYDPAEDVIYITQKYGTYRNHIGWQKREKASSMTVAPNYMTLSCFSHGNNISIEKTSDGKKYVWAPNYGTRQDDGSYDKPKIVSRFPLESGKTLTNTQTTENYYFGLNVTWPAFDFKNDMIAVCDYSNFYVYSLSEIMALPVEEITLDFAITYGGSSPVDTKIPEWSGKPTLKARDCRKAKLLYKVPFTYKNRNLHWQTFCIDNGWIFALLQADTKAAPQIIYDTYVEAYKMDGSDNRFKIRQEYMQNRDRILEFGWNERDYFYCEPEGIKVYDGIMLVMYTLRGEKEPYLTRRPVIFRMASPISK